MSVQQRVCRLCYEEVQENDGEIIEGHLREMLQAILIEIDLTISANPLICGTCHEKLQTNYKFKLKCISTEDRITPFVSENVKLNLKEVLNQIIKSEDIEDDKNVCRLCLQFVDNDMTLSEGEKEQFGQFFPEIDLSRTNFVILCSTCYDLLYKYFVFVTSCLNLEQQLYNYPLDQTEDKINIREDHVGIKSESITVFIKEEEGKEIIVDNENEELVLNEELVIKSEIKEEDNERHFDGDTSNDRWHTDSSCRVYLQPNYQEDLVQQVQSDHPVTKIYDNEAQYKHYLIKHLPNKQSDPFKIKAYKCKQCAYETNSKRSFLRHVQNKHSIPSKTKMYKCGKCSYEAKQKTSLLLHYKNKHSYPSTLNVYKCEICTHEEQQKSNLLLHYKSKHSAPSTIEMYKCENCTYEAKGKYNLVLHYKRKHVDPSTIKLYKCEICTYEAKQESDLIQHYVQYDHSESSTIKTYKCKNCSYETKYKRDLYRHLQRKHFKIYKCENCTFETKWKISLTSHVLKTHSH